MNTISWKCSPLRITPLFALLLLLICNGIVVEGSESSASERPNIVLIMTDDQGWGQTGYYNHPVLKTPNIDDMAANGLVMHRFYAGNPVCSPTRATVMTGRTNDRAGVKSHGYALRLQEKTIAQALHKAGYATGHFGKWHLDGYKGAGVPILHDDPHGPGAFGFDAWLSVTNYFDRDPLMSRQGDFQQLSGSSSEIIVSEALQFAKQSVEEDKPFFLVIWDGSPHSPFKSTEEQNKPFAHLDENSQQHYGELVAFDAALGKLRKGLKSLNVSDQTLVWYNSDNGGLPRITPDTVGGLRGNKGTLYEGGLRVPCVIEWPAKIAPRESHYPACTIDIFPTIAELLGLPADSFVTPVDGVSLAKLFQKEISAREKPIPFQFEAGRALIDNDWKIVFTGKNRKAKPYYQLYHLKDDPKEENDLSQNKVQKFAEMKQKLEQMHQSIQASIEGKDYPEGKVSESHPEPRFWFDDEKYAPYLDGWKNRWEYERYLKQK